jgi:hypothetical protein
MTPSTMSSVTTLNGLQVPEPVQGYQAPTLTMNSATLHAEWTAGAGDKHSIAKEDGNGI